MSPYVNCQPAARDPAEQDWITAVEANDLPALRALSVSCEVVPELVELEVAVPHLKPASR
jgi:hypothetical protein